jgi:hypothetical protein
LPIIAESVYRKGFNAELKGSINTAVNAYTSPEIGYPFNESIPEIKEIIFCHMI